MELSLISYIRHLQEKYSITQTNILYEFVCRNIPMNKGSLSHKLKGERELSRKELDTILNVLQCTSAERKEALRLFKIHKLGEVKYDELICMKNYIENFVEERIPFIYEKNVSLDYSIHLSNEKMLNSYIFELLKKAEDNSRVNIICQSDYQVLSSVLIHLYSRVAPRVKQLVCLNNSGKSENNTYNIRLIKTLNNLVARNYKHHVHYYYDDISSHLNSYTFYPYMITLNDMAIMISSDYKQGVFIKDLNIVNGINSQFDTIFNQSNDLFEVIENDFEYMKQCVMFESAGFEEMFALQYHPCTILNGNPFLADVVIKEEMPLRNEILEMYKNRLKMYKNKKQCFIYCDEGMDDFLKNGLTTDMSTEIFKPVPDVDRKNLAIRMQINRENVINKSIPATLLNIPKELTIMCYDNERIIVGYKHPDFHNSGVRLITKERSIYKSMLLLLKHLRDENEIGVIF